MLNQSLVILVGGKGTRIKRFTRKIPKPLIKINNNIFLEYILNYYSKYNFKKIFLLTGYKAYKFKKYNNKRSHCSLIKCIKEKEKLDTGGALLQLKNIIKDEFILINGDSYIDYDLKKFINIPVKKKYIGKMLLTKNLNYKTNKKLSDLNLIKNEVKFSGSFMNGGVYKFKKEIFKFISKKSSLENEILPKLIKQGKICGQKSLKNFIDIGTYKNLKKASSFFKNQEKISAAFFDRDGVINHEKNYVHKMKDFTLRRGVIEAIGYLNKKNIKVFFVTNQAGIGKKLYSNKSYLIFHNKIIDYFRLKNVYIDDMEYSPFHINAKIKKYRKKSNFRKPGNLMIEKLVKKWGINRRKAFMVGDNKKDYLAAKKSKLYFEYAEGSLFKQVKKLVSIKV